MPGYLDVLVVEYLGHGTQQTLDISLYHLYVDLGSA